LDRYAARNVNLVLVNGPHSGPRPAIPGALAAALLLVACGSPPAPPRVPSSIVLITIDTLRADHVNPETTPTLAALAAEAVSFDQAITVAPLTLPAHASLLTAQFPPRHGVRDNQIFTLPESAATYPSMLKQRGYATAAFVSAVVLDHRYGLNRGFDVYDDEIAGPERAAAETLARAERWIGGAGRPFFVWVHLFEPHAPYRAGSYAAEVTSADTALAGFFSHLRGAGLWDDLVLSITADHGEALGEHGEKTHGFFVYDAALRIPWILKAPGLASERVQQLVRIVDIMPTVAELAAPKAALAEEIDGVSFALPAARRGSSNLHAYSETYLPPHQFGWSPLKAIRTERFKYIEAPQPELYDLKADAGEKTNIVSSNAADADRLRRALNAMARGTQAATRPADVDPRLAAQLASLGYVSSSAAMVDPETPNLPDPKTKLDVYNLTMTALELSESGDLTAALDAVQQAERLDPAVAQVQFLEGTLLGQMGRNDQAVAALERTLALAPRYAAARFKLAIALVRLGRTDQATNTLKELLSQEPGDFRAWHNLAAIAYSRGDLDEAERLERRALAIAPDYAEAWNTLGAIALVRKQTDAALESLERATRLAPQNGQAFRNLSLALRQAGKADAARTAADRACALDQRLCRDTKTRRQFD
jgi:choline-sulfatase